MFCLFPVEKRQYSLQEGLSGCELAKMLEVSPPCISMILKRGMRISKDIIDKLNALGVDFLDIFGIKDENELGDRLFRRKEILKEPFGGILTDGQIQEALDYQYIGIDGVKNIVEQIYPTHVQLTAERDTKISPMSSVMVSTRERVRLPSLDNRAFASWNNGDFP